MKKKIFITGIVRDYDSADQQRLADEIKDYICQNIVGPDCADYVKVTKVSHLPFYWLSRIIKHCNILIDNLLTFRK